MAVAATVAGAVAVAGAAAESVAVTVAVTEAVALPNLGAISCVNAYRSIEPARFQVSQSHSFRGAQRAPSIQSLMRRRRPGAMDCIDAIDVEAPRSPPPYRRLFCCRGGISGQQPKQVQ